jgi:hypothetical protein
MFTQLCKYIVLACWFVMALFVPRPALALPVLDNGMFFVLSGILGTTIKMNFAAKQTHRNLKSLNATLNKIVNTSLDKIKVRVKKDTALTKKWQDENRPTTDYDSFVDAATNGLATLQRTSDTQLTALENNFFNNTPAIQNMALQYSQENSAYKIAMADGVMCPKSIIIPENKANYYNLQNSSCTIMYNATAYKKLLSQIVTSKQKIIDDATTKIAKATPRKPSIGDFDAKKTALIQLNLLQKDIMDEYEMKKSNADTQIKIAKETQMFAADAIVAGPPVTKKEGVLLALEAVKTGLAIGLSQGSVKYNE